MNSYTVWIPALTDRVLRSSKAHGQRIELVAWLGGHCADPYRIGGERRKRWQQWREHVAERLRYFMPGTAVPSLGWRVTTAANLASKVHPDAENVHKLIVDCLVARRGKSSIGHAFFLEDKDLAGAFSAVTHTNDAQGVRVTIEKVS